MRRTALFLGLILLATSAFAQDFGSGWTLEYYDSTDLSGGVIARQTGVGRLDFDWSDGDDLPDDVDEDEFSLRATTTLIFSEGSYRFFVGSDDGARLFVDGIQITDGFVARGFQDGEDQAVLYLPAGQHTVRVDYFQDGAGALLRVYWELEQPGPPAGGLVGGPLPSIIEDPQAPAAASAIVGSVQNVEGLSVRNGPYLGATRLDIIAPGTEYPVFARNEDEGEFSWYLITVQDFVDNPETGERVATGEPVTGWVSGRYFLINNVPEAVPIQSTIYESIGDAPDTGVRGVLRSNMRLRRGPSYRTETLQILDWGAEVEILGRTLQARQNHWFQVRYEGQVGWLFSPFITIIGDIDDVTTY